MAEAEPQLDPISNERDLILFTLVSMRASDLAIRACLGARTPENYVPITDEMRDRWIRRDGLDEVKRVESQLRAL